MLEGLFSSLIPKQVKVVLRLPHVFLLGNGRPVAQYVKPGHILYKFSRIAHMLVSKLRGYATKTTATLAFAMMKVCKARCSNEVVFFFTIKSQSMQNEVVIDPNRIQERLSKLRHVSVMMISGECLESRDLQCTQQNSSCCATAFQFLSF